MLDSLWPLVRAGLVFTVPLAILSFAFGLSLGFMTAVVRLFGPNSVAATLTRSTVPPAPSEPFALTVPS